MTDPKGAASGPQGAVSVPQGALSVPQGVRARVRAQLTGEILDAARRQLAEVGSSGLSLRAVARELGMVSSAVYRYYPSRDELLTALIVDAYEQLGDAVDAALAAARRADPAARWLACARAARAWAIDNPHLWGLIFGSPVPGYRAPTDTIDPAARVPIRLLEILVEGEERGLRAPDDGRPIPRVVRADLHALRDQLAPSLTDPSLARALLAWTALVGSIGMELFGHFHNVITDYPAYFDFQMRAIAGDLGVLGRGDAAERGEKG